MSKHAQKEIKKLKKITLNIIIKKNNKKGKVQKRERKAKPTFIFEM